MSFNGAKIFAREKGLGCRQRERASSIALQNKRKIVLAVALSALTAPQSGARAEDIAAEIRLLKEQVKQLQPLKARLKQLEAEVAREKREQKQTEAQVRRVAKFPPMPSAPPPVVCKDQPCPPP